MRLLSVAFAVLLSFLFTGCSVWDDFNDQRYSRNNAAGDEWLSDQFDPAEVDVSGTYRSRDWGHTLLVQDGDKVRGHLGDYPVKGVVSGRKLYLLISQGGWYYYSAILEYIQPGVLVGSYSQSVPYQRYLREELELVASP